MTREVIDVGTISGVEAHVAACGSGPPVLLLHGNPDTGALWDQVVERLAPDYRCYVPDLPGFGQSREVAPFDCSLDAMASFVEGVVEALRIDEPLALVGHDFGGPYGLAWAVRYPGRVRRIAAINTFFFSDYRWHVWGRIWRTPVLGELAMRLSGWHLFRFEMRRGARKLDDDYLRQVYARITPAMRAMVPRLYRASDPARFAGWEDRLATLTAAVPTVALWGMRDPYLPARFADRFGAREVHRFDDCGHWLPAEAPAEVAAILGRFFAAGDPEPSGDGVD